MRRLDKSDLPLRSSLQRFDLDPKRALSFQNALHLDASSPLPATWGAVAMAGVFEILNRLEVNWLSLLHGTQSFDFENPEPPLPFQAESESILADYRFRASVHWLTFETIIRDVTSQQTLIRSKCLIFVKEDSPVNEALSP